MGKPKKGLKGFSRWHAYLLVVCIIAALFTGTYFYREVMWITNPAISFLTGMLYPILVLSAYAFIDRTVSGKVSARKLAICMLPFIIMILGVFTTNLISAYDFNPSAFVNMTKLSHTDDPYMISYITFTQNDPELLDLRNNSLLDIFFLSNIVSLLTFIALSLPRPNMRKARAFFRTGHGKIFLVILIICIAVRLAGITQIGWGSDEYGWFRTGKATLLDNEHDFELWKPPMSLYLISLPSVVRSMIANQPLEHYHPIGLSRIFPLIAGIGACIIVYLLLRRATDRQIALQGFALMAIHPILVQYSRSAMNEIFLVLSVAATAYFLYKGVNEKGNLLLAVICATYALTVKGTGLYILIAVMCAALYLALPEKSQLKAIILLLPLFATIPRLAYRPETLEIPMYLDIDSTTIASLVSVFLGNATFIWILIGICLLAYATYRKKESWALITYPAISAIAFFSMLLPIFRNAASNLTSILKLSMWDFVSASRNSLFEFSEYFLYITDDSFMQSFWHGSTLLWYLLPFALVTVVVLTLTPFLLEKREGNRNIRNVMGVSSAVCAAAFLVNAAGVKWEPLGRIYIAALLVAATLFFLLSKDRFAGAFYYTTAFFVVFLSTIYRSSFRFYVAILPAIIILAYLIMHNSRTGLSRKHVLAVSAVLIIPMILIFASNYPENDYDMQYKPNHLLAEEFMQYHTSTYGTEPAALLFSDSSYLIKEIYGDTTFQIIPAVFVRDNEKRPMAGLMETINTKYLIDDMSNTTMTENVLSQAEHRSVATIKTGDADQFSIYDIT